LTDETEVVVVDAVAPGTETDVVVEEVSEEEVAIEAPAAPAAKENKFPKVINRAEDADITHYSPKAHTELDPASRFKD
jgi:hypothetical protein